jgi:glucosamine-phosphate N-acetyltransferase
MSYLERFVDLKQSQTTRVVVIEEPTTGRIVASGSLLVERKFIRQCGLVGHIEDIVVHDSQRGKNLGRMYVVFKHDYIYIEYIYT